MVWRSHEDWPRRGASLGVSSEVVHRLKNYICIICGFCELLIAESAEDDPRRADLAEIHKAAQAAMAMMPDVANRMR